MTDKEKIEKMVAEIDRLLSIKDLGFEDGDVEHGYKNCLRDLKRFYNSMQVSPCLKCEGDGLPGTCASISELGRCPLKNQKQEPVSEDLEKEMQHYFCKEWAGDPVAAARHFAEWQKQQMIKSAKLHGWVARDKNDSLHLFEVEPSRIEDRGQWWDRDYNCTTLDKNDFPDLEWEDEPVYVKLIVIKED